MAAERIAGICYFKVDGHQYSVRGNMKVQPLDTKKTGIAGSDGVHGFKEEFQTPYIDLDITDRGSLSMKTLQSYKNVTVTAELANGKTYVLRNAWYAGEGEIDGSEGKTTAKFEGLECLESMTS